MSEKKRILIGYIGDGHAGGVDKYILNLIYSINMEKYSIDILTNKINLKLAEQLEKKHIGLLEIPTLKHPISQYKVLKRLMEKKKYDVCYFNISTAINILGLLAAKKTGIPNRIVHSHSSGIDIENNCKREIIGIIHSLGKLFIKNTANSFIACSKKAGEWMFDQKIMQSPAFFLVYNSLSLEKFIFNPDSRKAMRERMNWKEKKIILHVANFTYQKNHEFLIKTFNNICKKNRGYILVLAGDGSGEEKVHKMVKEYGIEKFVVFTGKVSNIADYMNAADIFVLPSRFEGYPISALEAQINGLQCFLSDNITSESKIEEHCQMLPLDEQCWTEHIMNAKISECHYIVPNADQFDNKNLGNTIEKIWDRMCG